MKSSTGKVEPDPALDGVSGHRLEERAENAAVDRLPDPEPLETVAAVEADPAERAGEERPRRNGDDPALEIDRQAHEAF